MIANVFNSFTTTWARNLGIDRETSTFSITTNCDKSKLVISVMFTKMTELIIWPTFLDRQWWRAVSARFVVVV